MIHRTRLRWEITTVTVAAGFGGGLLTGLAAEPFHLWPLAWVGLAPLWLWATSPCRSWGHRLAAAGAWGTGYYGLTLFWITGVHPLTWMGVPWPASLAIAAFCWLAITTWGTALAIAWTLGLAAIAPRLGTAARIFVGVVLWCGLEGLWSATPLWWSSLALTQSPHNLAVLQWLQFSGPTTVVAPIVACNAVLAESWRSRRWRWLVGVGAVLALVYGIGWGLVERPVADATAAPLRVGLIQGNVPNEIKLSPQGHLEAISGYARGYAALADRGVDAVLTPETALPFFWSENLELARLQRARGIPAWVGAFGDADGSDGSGSSYTNSLFSIAADGRILDRFDKVKLVPLGEYVPLAGLLGDAIGRLSPIQARLAPGARAEPLKTPFGRAIVAICYESAFSEHFRQQSRLGGEFILSAANNAHYAPAMPAQHHAQDILRAIETDRWVVRATNTGYSAIIGPRGRTYWRSDLNTYALHVGTIARRQTQTLYVRWGDWLLWSAIGGGLPWMYFATKFLSAGRSQDLMNYARKANSLKAR